MKSLLLGLLFVGLPPEKNNVFLCKGSSIATYHAKKDCRGIKDCSPDLVEVSLEEATDQYKKKACPLCYRKPSLPFFPFPLIVAAGGED